MLDFLLDKCCVFVFFVFKRNSMSLVGSFWNILVKDEKDFWFKKSLGVWFCVIGEIIYGGERNNLI